MKKTLFFVLIGMLSLAVQAQTLRETVGKHFLIGAAVNTNEMWGRTPKAQEVIANQFNSIVAENCMKAGAIHPEEERFYWNDADQTVKFGEEHDMAIIGHCLIWHSQAPRWMFTDAEGKEVSREVLIERMHRQIAEVVGRYKGRIKGWDVINEAFNDDGTYRNTPYYHIIGPEYFELAYRFAHEADPNAELYYNDYSMALPAKRDAVCRLVRDLKSKGCRIDAVGMQSHNGLDYPDLKEYENTMDSLSACGVGVMITELDLNMLPNPRGFGGAEVSQNFDYEKSMNPYPDGLTEEAQRQFDERYLAFFDIYRRHEHQIRRITLWGVSDRYSWLNNFPVHGRTNHPLLFDRQYQPKPVVEQIIRLFQ